MRLQLAMVGLALFGCGGKKKAPDESQKSPPTTPTPAKPPVVAGPVTCVPEPDKFEVDGAVASLRGVLVDASVQDGKGLVIAELESAKVLGTQAVPQFTKVVGLVETREGLAALIVFRKSKDDYDGTLHLAKFAANGSPHGGVIDVPDSVVHYPLPGLHIGAFDDTLVLFEETKAMEKSQVQLMDLDAKLIGDPVDTGRGRIGQAARLGTSHSFAVFLRDHESDPDMVRIFDGDKRAWLGPQMDPGQPNIYGTATLGANAIVMMGVGPGGVMGATLDAAGKLSAWKHWAGGDDTTGHGVVSAADNGRAYALWVEGHGADAKIHVATVKPDLSLENDQASRWTGYDFSGALYAGADLVHDGDTRFRCK